MRQKIFTVALVLFFACLPSAGNAIYIDVGNGGFTSIQSAINSAATGDSILVHSGNYIENVTLKNGVNLIGDSDSSVKLEGIINLASNTNVSGMHVNPLNKGVGIYGSNVSNVNLFQNKISNVYETSPYGYGGTSGVLLEGSSNVNIYNNSVYNILDTYWENSYGIYSNNSSNISIYNNSIYDISETYWGSSFGIYNNNSSNALVKNNTVAFVSETAWDDAFGIYQNTIDNGISGTILNNIISYVSGDLWAGAYGIYDANGTNIIQYNDVWSVTDDGWAGGPSNYFNVSGIMNGSFDPMFVNASARNFDLQDGSLALTWANDGGQIGRREAAAVPEPSSILILGSGLVGIFAGTRKRKYRA